MLFRLFEVQCHISRKCMLAIRDLGSLVIIIIMTNRAFAITINKQRILGGPFRKEIFNFYYNLYKKLFYR